VLEPGRVSTYLDGAYQRNCTCMPADGVRLAGVDGVGLANGAPWAMWLGSDPCCSYPGLGRPFAGSLAEVKVHNRSISAAEVAADHAAGAAGLCAVEADGGVSPLTAALSHGAPAYFSFETNYTSGDPDGGDWGFDPVKSGPGAATRTCRAACCEGNSGALQLDGGYLSYGQPPALASLHGQVNLTVMMWMKAEPENSGNVYAALSLAHDDDTGIAIQGDNTMMTAIFQGGASRGCATPFDMADGEWHHFAAVNLASTILLYVDGQPVQDCHTAAPLPTGLHLCGEGGSGQCHGEDWQLLLGNDPADSFGRRFDGMIDEVRAPWPPARHILASRLHLVFTSFRP
jgi:hypothetical protein